MAESGGFAHGPVGENAARTGPFAKPTDPATQVLTFKERKIHEDGLVSVLKQIHDDLDAAVFAAYGWPGTLSDEEILERLVALNHERATEEAAGKIRWLRPEFQCPQTGGPTKTQQTFTEAEEDEDDSEEERDKGQVPRGGRSPPRRPPLQNLSQPPKPNGPPPSPNVSAPSATPSPRMPNPPQPPTSRASSAEPTKPTSPNSSKPWSPSVKLA